MGRRRRGGAVGTEAVAVPRHRHEPPRLVRVVPERVLIVDKRPHIAGNAYDRHNEAGILVHEYGPHIFHTTSAQIFDYLSKFTQWRPYEHRVLAQVDHQLLPIPINLDTVNKLYGMNLDSDGLEEFFQSQAEHVADIKTSEDVIVSRVGRDLYNKFFRDYTRKQWGLDPSQLDKSVTSRVPVRTDRDDRYFSDRFQFMPKNGYTEMFGKMLKNPKISVMLQTDYADICNHIPHKRLIYTGRIDEYFNYRYGELPYRSLKFDHVTLDKEFHQPVAVVNYPQSERFTRVTEYKYLTGQQHARTSLTYEYPCDDGETPYYPVPRPENMVLYKKYEALAQARRDVWFVGRLATYRYYNMDQIVGQALATFQRMQISLPAATSSKPIEMVPNDIAV